MNCFLKLRFGILSNLCLLLICVIISACSKSNSSVLQPNSEDVVQSKQIEKEGSAEPVEGVDYFLPNIDLNNWKVTLPIGNPSEVEPPEILDYPNVESLQKFMYNDSTDGSLVFYTYPGASTRNSSYSRTELREQMVPGSNKTNWTFAEGGRMKGELKVEEISRDNDDKYHRTIIMQIHGRLTDEQRDLIGEDDNNAPPILKIYWNKERIRVLRKVLKNVNVDDVSILKTSAWTDEGHWFSKRVGFDKFELEVIVAGGKMAVVLDGEERLVFDDIHMQKWGVFENYFKAGNYLVSKDSYAFAKVKYYNLSVSH